MTRRDATAWPAWATEQTRIADPDPAWGEVGAALVNQLRDCLAPWLRDGVHHVGSTSVPGLAAKPIIDVMAGVDALDAVADIGAALPEGWHYVDPELDQRWWRRFFVLVRSDRRAAHLHVMTANRPRWRDQLAFRDRLRTRPTLREEYAALKRRLAVEHSGDREAYGHAKTEFVARVLAIST